MITPRILCTGSYEFLPYAKSKYRQQVASAQFSGGFGHHSELLSDGGTLIVKVSPTQHTIILIGGGVTVTSGLVAPSTIQRAVVGTKTVTSLDQFYPSSLQATSEKLTTRAWRNEPKIANLMPANLYSQLGYWWNSPIYFGGQIMDQIYYGYQPAENLTNLAQTAIISPNLYTGLMEKAVQVAMGVLGQTIQYDFRYNTTHGIFTSSTGVLWLIEISAQNGVIAKKLTGNKSTSSSMNTLLKTAGLPFVPDGKAFPADITTGVANGSIIVLLAPGDLFSSSIYGTPVIQMDGWPVSTGGDGILHGIYPVYDACGWAFNSTGSEAQNIYLCLESDFGINGKSYRTKVSIKEVAGVPSSAMVTLMDSGYVSDSMQVPQKAGYSFLGSPANWVFANPIPAPSDGLTTTANLTIAPGGASRGTCPSSEIDGPLYVFYNGDEEMVWHSAFVNAPYNPSWTTDPSCPGIEFVQGYLYDFNPLSQQLGVGESRTTHYVYGPQYLLYFTGPGCSTPTIVQGAMDQTVTVTEMTYSYTQQMEEDYQIPGLPDAWNEIGTYYGYSNLVKNMHGYTATGTTTVTGGFMDYNSKLVVHAGNRSSVCVESSMNSGTKSGTATINYFTPDIPGPDTTNTLSSDPNLLTPNTDLLPSGSMHWSGLVADTSKIPTFDVSIFNHSISKTASTTFNVGSWGTNVATMGTDMPVYLNFESGYSAFLGSYYQPELNTSTGLYEMKYYPMDGEDLSTPLNVNQYGWSEAEILAYYGLPTGSDAIFNPSITATMAYPTSMGLRTTWVGYS